MPKEFDPAVTRFVRENLPAVLPHHLTLKEQAKTIGVSDATLSDVLNDRKGVGKSALPRFAKALGVSVDELVRRARSEGYRPAAVERESAAVDTLAMATEAVEDLVELDGVKKTRAWEIVRDIKLNKPSSRGYYREARRRLEGKEGSRVASAKLEDGITRQSGARGRPRFAGQATVEKARKAALQK